MEHREKNLVTRLENDQDFSGVLSPLLELDEVDRVVLRHMSENPTLKPAQIAKLLGVKEALIRRRAAKPAFRLARQKLLRTTDDLMETAAKKAAVKLLDLLEHPNPMIQLGAIKIALAKFLAKAPEPTEDEIIEYRTNIEFDGQLFQTVVKKEIEEQIIDV